MVVFFQKLYFQRTVIAASTDAPIYQVQKIMGVQKCNHFLAKFDL